MADTVAASGFDFVARACQTPFVSNPKSYSSLDHAKREFMIFWVWPLGEVINAVVVLQPVKASEPITAVSMMIFFMSVFYLV